VGLAKTDGEIHPKEGIDPRKEKKRTWIEVNSLAMKVKARKKKKIV